MTIGDNSANNLNLAEEGALLDLPPTAGMPDVILTSRFEQALVYSNELHRWQARKGTGIPYIAHLLAVASMVLEQGGDEDEAIAALLHDSIEDQDMNPNELELRFGVRVAEIVIACSDGLDGQRGKGNWRARKEKYLKHLRHASPSVRLVSAADKLHNLRTTVADYDRLGEGFWTRFNSTREDNIWFYEELTAALRAAGETRLVSELSEAVDEFKVVAAKAR